MNALRWILAAGLWAALALSAPAQAAAPPELPAWDDLTPEQRETLTAALRERWDQAAYEQRLRWLRGAERWQKLTPEERRTVRQGMRAFRRADPQTREQLRDVFRNLRQASPEERERLREKWRSLSPAQRRAWMEAGGPGVAPPPGD